MRYIAAGLFGLLLALVWLLPNAPAQVDHPVYRSPSGVAFSPDGQLLAVADTTANEIVLLNPATGDVKMRLRASQPRDVLWSPSGSALYATTRQGLQVFDPHEPKQSRLLDRGSGASQLAWWQTGGAVLCAYADSREVHMVKAVNGAVLARWYLPAEPFTVSVAPKSGIAVVGRLIADGDANSVNAGASLNLINLNTRNISEIRLPPGASDVRGIAISPDERWAYVAHCIGNTALPTTHLDGGWVNNNAFTIVDLQARKVYASVLMDTSTGAADPWGLRLTSGGDVAWVALSGIRSIARIDVAKLMDRIKSQRLDNGTPLLDRLHQDASASGITLLGRFTMDLENCIDRVDLGVDGPRALAVSPDGSCLAVGSYFAGQVKFVEARTGSVLRSCTLGPQPPESQPRRGERLFHDATHTRLSWLSCATCHPDGRADGLNWDLLNDGAGNPKNTRSLLYATRRSPLMSHGIRKDVQACVTAGFRHIEFSEPKPGDIEAVKSYIATLTPRQSPYRLADGARSEPAKRGKVIFDGAGGCSGCHTGQLLTDSQRHNVGTGRAWDTMPAFVTPSLREVWRTAPYLHDGGAATVYDVITGRNTRNQHGSTRQLSRGQLRDLEAYVLSL